MVMVVVLACFAAACTSESDAGGRTTAPDASAATRSASTIEPDDSTSSLLEPPPADDDRVPGAPDALDAAGIQVVERERDLVAIEAPVILTRVQSDRLLADVRPAVGVLGSALDGLAPLPADVPSMSYIVAAWVDSGTSVAAETARQWMGEQDWTQAPQVQFPEAVLAMFVNDFASMIDDAAPAGDETVVLDADAFVPPGPDDVEPLPSVSGFARSGFAGPCTAVQNFIGATITALVNALRIPKVNGGGILGDLLNAVTTIINVAIGFAAGAARVLIDELTAPVFDLIRVAVATIGIATQFTSFFRDHKLTVVVDPSQSARDYRFAVGAEADIAGQFVARAPSLTGEWPSELVDCARSTGVTLPQAIGVGAETTWTVEQATAVIAPATLTTKVRDDHSARLDFTTGRESEEQAAGELRNAAARVTARIQRKDVEELLQLGRSQVALAKALVLGRVPLPLRPVVEAALSAIIDPLLKRADAELAGAAAGIFALSGVGQVFVSFHVPPATTTTESTPPPTEPDDDFCTQFRDLVDFVTTEDPDIVAWATEIVRRLEKMRPLAPGDLVDDVDVLLRVYRAVAAEASVLVLIETTEPLPQAAGALGDFCGISGLGG